MDVQKSERVPFKRASSVVWVFRKCFETLFVCLILSFLTLSCPLLFLSLIYLAALCRSRLFLGLMIFSLLYYARFSCYFSKRRSDVILCPTQCLLEFLLHHNCVEGYTRHVERVSEGQGALVPSGPGGRRLSVWHVCDQCQWHQCSEIRHHERERAQPGSRTARWHYLSHTG